MAVRKKRVFKGCANPLFVKWVEELRDEAVEKNSKSQYTYSKALSSLRRYPLPLASGQEAKLLDHIGEQLAKILDRKLQQYKKNGVSDDNTASQGPELSGGGKKKGKKQNSPSGGVDVESSSPPQSKRQKSAPREYIPVYRSGSYALIVALHEAEQKPSWCGYLRKDELIAEAQPLSDSSFTVKKAGSYYTAWSSMSKLVERGLIIRYRNPPKFKLSEKGVSMAVRLLQGGPSGPDSSQCQTGLASQTSHSQTSPGPSGNKSSRGKSEKMREKEMETPSQEKFASFSPVVPDLSPSSSVLSTSSWEDEDQSHSLPSHLSTQPHTPHSSPQYQRRLEFWYVSPEGLQVHCKDEAAVTFNEELSVGFLIKCRRQDLEKSIFQYTIDPVRPPEGDFIFAYLSNEQGPDYSNPPLSTCDPTPKPRLTSPTHTVSETPLTNHTPTPSHLTPSTTHTPTPSHLTQSTSLSSSRASPPAPILITLSDSDREDCTDCVAGEANSSGVSDDVEILRPLSERVGFKRKTSVSESESTSSKKIKSTSSNSGTTLHEELPGSRSTPVREGSVRGETSLTPAQKAGLAAIERVRTGRGSKGRQTVVNRSPDSESLPSQRGTGRSGRKNSPRKLSPRKSVISKHLSPPSAVVVDLTCPSKPPQFTGARHSQKPGKENISVKEKNSLSVSSRQPEKENAGLANENSSSITHSNRGRHPALKKDQSLSILQQEQNSSVTRQPSSTSCSPVVASLEGVELGSPEFVLRPGEFEVVLCVDSAESVASRKNSSQFRGLLLQELGKNGVQFDVRKLNVGDFLWVGREKVCPVPGQLSLPQSREVVLEYIVERKRMDDLAGSITDGRFREQKFRLQGCGLSSPVYLVERHGDSAHLNLPLRSLNQAISSTQVIDRFFVKRTEDIRESVAYLTIMTRQLQTHYSNKTLKAYPHETITNLVRTKHRQSFGGVVYSMPFPSFNEASIKNKVLSVYEMFGRQLIQLPSFSADKAVAVLELYPTVAHLHRAYHECSTTGERVKLLSNIRAGRTKRRLGDSLSTLVYSLYWLGKDA